MPDDPVCRSKACAGRCKRSAHAASFEPPSWRYRACRIHRACERFADVEPFADVVEPFIEECCRHTKADDGLCHVPDCPEGPDSRRTVPRSADGTERAGWPEGPAPAPLPPHTPGAGAQRLRDLIPELSAEDRERARAEVDDIVQSVETAPPEPELTLTMPSPEAMAAVLRPMLRRGALDLGPPRQPTRLASWDSWWCETCESRAFEPRTCCDKAMRPVRVELHTREVGDA